MTSTHKLLALAIIWLVVGGVLTTFLINATLYNTDSPIVIIVSVLAFATAVAATYFVTKSPDETKFKL